MAKIVYYIILALVVFVVLAWDSDIKPRIFSNPDAVTVKPSFKLGLLIYLGCFSAAFFLFIILQSFILEFEVLRYALGTLLTVLAVIFGRFFTKRSLRRIFYETAISLRMNPEEYAKTLVPHFVVDYIENHLSDKEALAKQIKYYRSRNHISDACAWAFLVAYCDKRP